jgi:hypothetical protein
MYYKEIKIMKKHDRGIECLKYTLFELSTDTDLYNYDLIIDESFTESAESKLGFFDTLKLKVNKAAVEIMKNIYNNTKELELDKKEENGIYKQLNKLRNEKIYKVEVIDNEKALEEYKKMIRSLIAYCNAIINSNDSGRAYKEFKDNLDDFDKDMDYIQEDHTYMSTDTAIDKLGRTKSYTGAVKDIFGDVLDTLSDMRSEVSKILGNGEPNEDEREKIYNLNNAANKLSKFAVKYNSYFANRYPVELYH